MNINQLRGKTVGAAVSGGLDSCTISQWLVENDVKVVAYTADLGQPDEVDIDDIRTRMLASGAEDAILIDAREEMAMAGIKLIQAQGMIRTAVRRSRGMMRGRGTTICSTSTAARRPCAIAIRFCARAVTRR